MRISFPSRLRGGDGRKQVSDKMNSMKEKMIQRTALAGLSLVFTLGMQAQDTSDFGLCIDAGLEKKLDRHWAVGAKVGARTRNNSSDMERWSLDLDAAYKPNRHVKLSAGYDFFYDRHATDMSSHQDGSVFKFTPPYWSPRHRFRLAVTGSLQAGPIGLSWREQYQYTYRPVAQDRKHNLDTDEWEDVQSKSQHQLRSRLQASYTIRRCPAKPFASVEVYHGKGGLQKTRYTAGADLSLSKHHAVKLYYRFQTPSSKVKNGQDMHSLGLAYTYKL